MHSILGCYSINMYGTTLFFIVQENPLWSADPYLRIHERYNLKGSRVDAVGMWSLRVLSCCTQTAEHEETDLKDNDLRRTISVSVGLAPKVNRL